MPTAPKAPKAPKAGRACRAGRAGSERESWIGSAGKKQNTFFFSESAYFPLFTLQSLDQGIDHLDHQSRWRSPSRTVRDPTIPTLTIAAALTILTVTVAFFLSYGGDRFFGGHAGSHGFVPSCSEEGSEEGSEEEEEEGLSYLYGL